VERQALGAIVKPPPGQKDPIPEPQLGLLAGVAAERPFISGYYTRRMRSGPRFGTGTFGDMGCTFFG